MSDECVEKLREIIDSCRSLAGSMDPHPTAKALCSVADRLELNLVLIEDETGQASFGRPAILALEGKLR